MSGPSGEQCGRCYYSVLYWDEDKEDPYLCFRYPPSMPAPKDDYKDAPMPPVVSTTYWCGEFKPKPEQPT